MKLKTAWCNALALARGCALLAVKGIREGGPIVWRLVDPPNVVQLVLSFRVEGRVVAFRRTVPPLQELVEIRPGDPASTQMGRALGRGRGRGRTAGDSSDEKEDASSDDGTSDSDSDSGSTSDSDSSDSSDSSASDSRSEPPVPSPSPSGGFSDDGDDE